MIRMSDAWRSAALAMARRRRRAVADGVASCTSAIALQQRRGRGGVMACEAGGGLLRSGCDRPVAGRRIVHGVVELRRRHRLIRGQRLQYRMHDGTITVRRGEHAGNRARRDPGHFAGLLSDDQRQPRRLAGSSPLGGGQQGRGGRADFARRRNSCMPARTGWLAGHPGNPGPQTDTPWMNASIRRRYRKSGCN